MRYQQTGTIAATPPFDFAHTLAFLSDFPATAGEQEIDTQTLTKAVLIDDVPIAFTVRASGTSEEPGLAYTLHADTPLDPAHIGAARDRIGFFLGLTDDLRPFYAIGATDPAFAPVQAHLYGYHQTKFLTPFENACWAILTQRRPRKRSSPATAAALRWTGDATTPFRRRRGSPPSHRTNSRRLAAVPDAGRICTLPPAPSRRSMRAGCGRGRSRRSRAGCARSRGSARGRRRSS